MSYLTAMDENIINNPQIYKDGKLIDTILERKIVDKNIDIHSLCRGDRDAIVLWLRRTGYGNGTELSFYHEVGNIYNGTFLLDDVQHDFTVRTDGWHVEYQIDNGRTKTWKP